VKVNYGCSLGCTKRSAIAIELADLKALQEWLIANQQKLLPALSSDRFNNFLKDDREEKRLRD
jgi:hypothetical protein